MLDKLNYFYLETMAEDLYREIKELENRINQLKILESNPYVPTLSSGMSIISELPKVDILENKLVTKNAEIEYLTKRLDIVESFTTALHASLSNLAKKVFETPDDPDD